MSTGINPYAPPTAPVEDVSANSEAEAIRRAHINHEASVKSVGILYYLGGVALTIAGIVSLAAVREGSGDPLMALLFLGLGAVELVAGWGVRALRRWGQVVGCVPSVIGLLGFPIGTLISLYILYLLLSKKGRTIFSPAYQDVIAATPHVKYRTSIVVWIFLALLVALLVAAIGIPYFAKR